MSRRTRRGLRLALVPALVAVLATLLTACGGGADQPAATGAQGDPVEGGWLVYATDVQPQAGAFDPYGSAAFANTNVRIQIFESLLVRDDEGEIQPSLATEWEQTGPTTYRFTLRGDVKFHKGQTLTAEDVVYSFEQATAENSSTARYYKDLQSVTAVDDQTVDFQLAQPSGAFINYISYPPTGFIVNKETYSAQTPDEREVDPNGTGPFKLEEWQDNVAVRLAKHTEYWDAPLPYLDGVEFQIIGDEGTRLQTIRQQTGVHAAWFRDARDAETAAAEGFVTDATGANRTTRIYINATSGPLSDVNFRRAVSTGIDREALIDYAMDGNGELTLTVPIGDPGAVEPSEDIPYQQYDPDEAKALLAESGVTDPTISITYAGDSQFALDVPMVEAMKEQLAEVGITLELNGITWSEALDRVQAGDYEDLLLIPSSFQADVTSYFSFLEDAPRNQLGGQEAEASALLQELYAETDPKLREDKLLELETAVAEDVLALVPYATARQEVWSMDVGDYSSDPYSFRIHLKEAWLAQ